MTLNINNFILFASMTRFFFCSYWRPKAWKSKAACCGFRLDRYRGDPKEDHRDCFDFENHIYVDDAFMTEKETGKRLVNSYVEDLIQVVIEVYR